MSQGDCLAIQYMRVGGIHLSKGHLKIFFGYCAGVGKTYAMLQAAQQKQAEGVDVVIGYIEQQERPLTQKQMEGLVQLPLLLCKYHGMTLQEFDLDGALRRNPSLILVDELAHTNAAGCRHPKRYCDVEELLRNGIDVYTTLNVQHLESLHDIVAGITRIRIQERIPDDVFDHADQVELIDVEADDLIQRLQEGKIYQESAARRAMEHFFQKEHLIALRQIALRRCADRINRSISLQERSYTREHILVCLSASPSNAKVIRTAARMASAFFAELTALYVDTGAEETMDPDTSAQLNKNRMLAQRLHAEYVSVYGEDIAGQISEYVRISGISKVVIGRPNPRHMLIHHQNLIDTLSEHCPDLTIFVIPDGTLSIQKKHRERKRTRSFHFNTQDTLISVSIFTSAFLIAWFLQSAGISEANIIMCDLLAVFLISYFTKSRIYGFLTSILMVLTFNFLFTEPRFSFQAYDSTYTITFSILLLVSMITNTLTRKIKQTAHINALQAQRTQLLLETSQMLQIASSMDDLATVTLLQFYKLLHKTIIIYLVKDNILTDPLFYDEYADKVTQANLMSPNERAVAEWVFHNNKMAGVSTSTLSAAKALYYSIRKQDRVYAVLGIAMSKEEQLPSYEKSLVTMMLNEISLAMASMEKQQLYTAVTRRNEI